MPSYLFLCSVSESDAPAAVAKTLKAAIEQEGAIRHLWAGAGDSQVVALGLLDGPHNQTKIIDAIKTKHEISGRWIQVETIPAGDEIDDGHWKGGLESGSI
jgi:hypothetical protein